MLLEFLNEPLSWKQSNIYLLTFKDTNKDSVKDAKIKAFRNP